MLKMIQYGHVGYVNLHVYLYIHCSPFILVYNSAFSCYILVAKVYQDSVTIIMCACVYLVHS